MSRKAKADKSSWNLPSIYAFVGGYGPFRTKAFEPIKQVVVLLTNDNAGSFVKANQEHPAMHGFAGEAQGLLLNDDGSSSKDPTICNGILLVNVRDVFKDQEEFDLALKNEATQDSSNPLTPDTSSPDQGSSKKRPEKGCSKLLAKMFKRMRLHNVVLAANGELCALALNVYKLLVPTDPDMIAGLRLVYPKLSAKFINNHMVTTTSNNGGISKTTDEKKQQPVTLHLVAEKENSRVDMLRHCFPQLSVCISEPSDSTGVLAMGTKQEYDPDYCNTIGKSLFVSSVSVEINRHTKQYERICDDITENLTETKQLFDPDTGVESIPNNPIDWDKCERQVGALLLRGNRCVLVRNPKWTGMRLPSVSQGDGETPVQAAIRAAVEFCEVDDTEVREIKHILPVAVYAPNSRPLLLELYALYATEAPPDGPLEDADLEDDETPYDWYTFPNALKTLDAASGAGLRTMSFNLIQAANVSLLQKKWGGVFGQEMQLVNDAGDDTACNSLVPSLLTTTVTEEWKPSRQGDMLQDVRKATSALLNQKLSKHGERSGKLPVTLLSGFLGSGKTTLLSHILDNYEGLKVAILVNDMGEINIDAALIKSNSNASVLHREEHMVEMSNGCICCTLREDLLVEVAKIAADRSFDYLLIESSGVSEPMPVAETFAFEDSTGLRLGDIAQIDTLVTVVDGSGFMLELDSLESLQNRNWQADPEDQRTISHLLCDQVEFANVIVLNKCDRMNEDEREKVKTLIRSMNPLAKLVESVFSKVSLETVLGTGLFSMSDAEKHEGWLQEARIGEHTPETEEYGIGSFTFRAIRPFLPQKLNKALEAMLDKSSAPFDKSIVLRAKGFVWLANCPQIQGEFSLAGNHFSLLPGNPWWAEIDKSHWPENLERAIAPLWHEPYGDRQQEIVIIGQSLDKDAVRQVLNECLVSEVEMEQGQDAWNIICSAVEDPFQETWDAAIELATKEMDGHHHDHDHSHDKTCADETCADETCADETCHDEN